MISGLISRHVMSRRIELSQEVEQDIDAILDYSLTTFGEAQAEEYYLSLRGCFRHISDNPQIGRLRPELDPALRSYNHRSHVVFYDVQDD